MSSNSLRLAPIPGYEDLYWASDQGNIISRSKILKPYTEPSGYLQVSLCKNGKVTKYRIHRLVLLAFVGAPPNKCEACHNDGVKSNNKLENLRWDTKSSNGLDKKAHGVITPKGSQRPGSKLSEAQATKIRDDKRSLRAIAKEYNVHCTTILAIKKGRTWSHV